MQVILANVEELSCIWAGGFVGLLDSTGGLVTKHRNAIYKPVL
jgi:hypothetical protein